MSVRNVLIAALALSAMVDSFMWMRRPSDLNAAPLFFPFLVGSAFAVFLLVVFGGCSVFLWLRQFKAARDLCLLGGVGAVLVWVGLVALPQPIEIFHDPATVSLGIGMGLISPLGLAVLALIVGGIIVHLGRCRNIAK